MPRNIASARMMFQWKYMDAYYAGHPIPTPETPPLVLNIGCADDPLDFGELAHHVDIDDWSYKHKYFTQSDIHSLPFPDQSYEMVICADVLEHVLDPEKAVRECGRIVQHLGIIVFTVFEEWLLPGHGQWVQESHILSDIDSQELGYKDREDYQQKMFPLRKGVRDDEVPHLAHINQFNDDDIHKMIIILQNMGFVIVEYLKAYEQTYEGHDWFNWLLSMQRMTV